MKRKTFSKVAGILITLMILFTYLSPLATRAEGKSKMQTYVEDMQPGWNLGNSLDATGDERSWGNPLTSKELIDAIAEQGFKSIRIPVTWGHRMNDDNKIDPDFLDRVAEIVNWSLDAGMYVMLNMHHDSDWIYNMKTDRTGVLDRYRAAWTQISDYFKDYPDKLMFEAINEPRFDEDWGRDTENYFDYLYDLNTSFYQIVRGSGGKNKTRPLVLTTITSGHAIDRLRRLKETIDELKDDNIIATVHYYGYWPFSVNLGGATSFDDQAKGDIETTIDRLEKVFVKEGIPVVIGEYGLLAFDDDIDGVQAGEVLKYFEYFTYYTRLKGITHMLWDNGQHFDRNNLVWNNPALYETIAHSVQGRSSNAKSNLLFIKEGEDLEDKTIDLKLNGNELVSLKIDDRQLIKDKDYRLEGDKLLLLKDLLASLLDGDLGLKAKLECSFSSGPDWAIEIIKYKTPLLLDVRRTKDSFMLPTKFNGDRLKTLEAVYLEGGNAGSPDWTSFKQYSYAFTPSYQYNNIRLTEDFLNEIKDDKEVLLKLHFWSGEVIEYSIIKNGKWIEGVSSQEAPGQNEPDPTSTPEPTEDESKDEEEPKEPQETKQGDKSLLIWIIVIILGVIAVTALIVWSSSKRARTVKK